MAVEVAVVSLLENNFGWTLVNALILVALFDLLLAGISLRVGGQLAKGPYLPETLEGISRTTKAVLGKS